MNNKLQKWINKQKWTFAKTYAKTAPHEYVIRDNLSIEDKKIFDDFAMLIGREGYVKFFYKTPFKYLDIDGKKYWRIENIINRDDTKSVYK